MGTGSNCTYFDGSDIFQNVVSLGYILMDEASGNFYGKQLIRGYYFNEMPENLKKDFESKFDLSPDTVKENVYRKENPNTYLAKFAEFLILHKEDPYMNKIIVNGMRRFIVHQIMQFENAKSIPIHFVGSISFLLKKELNNVLKEYGLKMGNVIQRPIDGLVEYHIQNLKNS